MNIIRNKQLSFRSLLIIFITLFLYSEVLLAFNTNFSGRVNRVFRYADNSEESGTQILDNSTSETRFKLHISQEEDDLKVGAALKVRLEGYDSESYDVNGGSGSSNSENLDVTHALMYAKSGWGTFSFGRGNHADRGATRADFSGTELALNNDHRLSSGIRLFEGMTYSGFTLGQFTDNYDGDRGSRIQYNTPTVNGFTGKISYAPDKELNTWALGANYDTNFGSTKLQLRAGYNHVNGDGSSVDDSTQFGISGSFLLPNGMSFTGGYGKKDIENTSPSFDRESTGYYGKIGYLVNNTTTLAIDLGSNDDAAFDGSESTFFGLGKQKQFTVADCEGQAFFGYRRYQFDTPASVSPDDVDVLYAGLQIEF
ncbi:MAG: porin [Pseudomonadales bacterium]|jgi:hypothetical protein|nr:porin [Pseudomonadales bacterium]